MSYASFVKVKARTAAEICAHLDLKKEARSLLCDGMSPREFVEALATKQQYVTGIEFIAHALPAREGIWWGCLCLQHTCGNNLSGADRAACQAVVQWVVQPTEANRAAAKAPAETAGPASPAGALATAVNQTGGNIAPPKAPPMSPLPFAPAKAVSNAVKLVSVRSEPAKIVDTQRAFLELGIRIAEGHFI